MPPQNNIDVILRVLNSRRFQREMYSAGRSTRALGRSFTEAATASSGLTAAGAAAEGTMFAVGAAARAAGAGVAAASAAIVGFGIQFNATIESGTVAFEHFAGSASQSEQLLRDLWEIAENTPFEFTDITQAGRKFLAFGYTVEETKSLLDTLGDTLAVTGGGPLEIQRLTKAFGDIRAKGRLMQQELNQLTNVGVNPYEMLAKGGLTLTEKQLKNVGRAFIPADQAIRALQKGLEQTFGGGAEKYLNTFNGQVAKLRDNLKQAAGGETKGLFGALTQGLKDVNEWIDRGGAGRVMDTIMDITTTVIGGLGVAFSFAADIFQKFLDALKPAQPFFENIILPVLTGIGKALLGAVVVGFALLYGAIKILAPILGWIGDKLEFLKPVFEGIGYVIGFVLGPWILKVIGWIGKLGGVFSLLGIALGFLAIPFRIGMAVFKGLGVVVAGIIGWFGRLIGRIPGVAAAFGGLLSTVRGWGTSIYNTIRGAIESVLNRLGEFGTKLYVLGGTLKDNLVKGFKGAGKAILGAITGAAAWVGGIGTSIRNWINENTLFGDTIDLKITSVKIPALASGGTILDAGMALVGERGPEIVTFNRGDTVYPTGTAPPARVAPLRPAQAARPDRTGLDRSDAAFAPMRVYFEAPIHLDRRQIGMAMGEYVAERRARR